MKNKLLTFVLTAMACLISPCLSAETYNGTCGENLTWTLDTETGVLTISGTGEMENYVYSSDAPWSYYSSSIKTVTIGNSVTSIGSWAFYYCSSLTSITIPSSVTSIGIFTFYYCSSLTSITIPNSVTSIGKEAFSGCSSLTSVTIPNSVTSIGYNAFNGVLNVVYNGTASGSPWGAKYYYYNCYVDGYLIYSDDTKTELLRCLTSEVGEIAIPSSVTSIGDYAFSDCSSFTSVTIPSSVTSIGEGAFYGCSSLTSVTIPNSVTSIEKYAFSGCSSLPIIENIRYADTYLVESVDKTLSMYNIKEGTRWIGNYAFSDCSSLSSIEIPNSIKSIGYSAFKNCTSLAAVHIADLAAWCAIDFGKYEYVDVYYYSATTNPLYFANHLFLDGDEIKELEIPAGVTNINPYAFVNGSSLTSVRFPQSVETIGKSAFEGCSAVKRIYCHAVTPPAVESESFANYNAYLYVPCASFEDYDLHDVWGSFKHIECLPEDATALDDPMTGQQSSQAKKIFRNGTICIERDGILYDLQGAIIQ